MADEVVIRFKKEGEGDLAQTIRQLTTELLKLQGVKPDKTLRDTSAATTQLAQTLGTSFKNAQQFTKQLGLTAEKSAEAVTKLRDLDRVGTTTVEKFRALSREMGITRAQFDQLNQTAGKTTEGLQGIAGIAGGVGAGLGAIAAKGLKVFASFDDSISKFAVITQSSGTPALAALRLEVEKLAAVTTKTPQQVADVAVELGKAGFTAEQTKEALAGVVQSSEATGESLSATGEVIGATLNQFGLSASNSGKIADLLTQASNASAAGVVDLGEALSFVGAQAAGSNQSVDDTITSLALLANAGIKGSSAGTGLAAALLSLKNASAAATTEIGALKSGASEDAVAAFKILNNEVRDSSGKLLPFPAIIQKIKASIGGLKQVDKDLLLNALFGVEGGRVVQTLLNTTDEKLQAVTSSMQNAEGAAAKASKELNVGLNGAFNLLSGSIDLALSKVGGFLAVGLEPLVRGAAEVVNSFATLPAPIQQVVVVVGALAGTLAAATAVLTAYQLLNIGTTAALTLKTAATIASTIATGASTSAQLLFNTQITITQARLVAIAAAQGTVTIAQQAYALATGAAATATAGFSAALLTVVAPLAVLGAGIALVGLVKLTEQLSDTNNRLEELRTSTDAVLGSGINAETKLKAAIDARNTAKQKGLALTQEQINAEKQAVAQADKTLALLKQQLAEAEKTPQAQAGLFGLGQAEAEAQNNARAANIASINQQIQAIEKQKQALSQGTEAAKANTGALKDNKEARKEDAAKLKQSREDEQRKKQQAFQDAQSQKEQAFQDAKQQKEQAFQDAKQAKEQTFQDQQAAKEQAFQDAKQTREQSFQDAKQQREQTFSDQQRAREQAFQDQQKAAQDAFQEGQRAKTEAFNKKQQADQEAFTKRQSDEKAAFDKQLSGEEKAINRRQQLRDADTPEAKANLRKQFREQDRNARELEPLEAKRKAFEEKQKAEAKAEEERREAEKKAAEEATRAEQVAFEAQQKEDARLFQESQRQLEAAFKLQEREADRAFKLEQQTAERAFKAEQQAAEKTFKAEQQAADRAFKQEEQAADRAFKAQQRAVDRAFKQQEREFDLETARQVKAIKDAPSSKEESTPDKPPPAPTPTTKPPGRRLGGAVDAGSLYQVGEAGPEYFVPSQNGYVIRHEESLALAREALSSRAPIPSAVMTPSVSNSALLSEMRATRRVMEKIGSRDPNINVPVTFEGSKSEGNSDRFWRLQRAMYRGMIG